MKKEDKVRKEVDELIQKHEDLVKKEEELAKTNEEHVRKEKAYNNIQRELDIAEQKLKHLSISNDTLKNDDVLLKFYTGML